MNRTLPAVFLFLTLPIFGQSTATTAPSDPLKPLAFLEGNWDAKGQGGGATAAGSYSFQRELGGHILARHSRNAECKGPANFDCEHGDLLYVYAEGQALKAIYFDSEGHVIHYDVSMPAPHSVVFLSGAPGPQFHLAYTLEGGVMAGKFQMRMPGQTDWKSYLEWSGGKK